jgi:nucleotide-binding universal stress UspA family protein
MARTLLVGLDESPWGQAAAETALRIAELSATPRRLLGLHVVGVTHLSGDLVRDLAGLLGFEPVLVPEQVELVYRRRGTRLLRRFQIQAEARGLDCRTLLETGAQVPRMVHHASGAELTLIGVRGESEQQDPGTGGGRVERFVKHAPHTVLVTGDKPVDLGGVTLGYDGSQGSVCALRAVRNLLGGAPMEVQVVHVGPLTRGPDPLEEARSELADSGLQCSFVRVEGEPYEALASAAEDAGHELLALGYRGRSVLGGLLLGRVTEQLLGRAELSLLIAR